MPVCTVWLRLRQCARAYLTRVMLARGHVDDTFSLIQPQDLVQDDSTLIVRTPQCVYPEWLSQSTLHEQKASHPPLALVLYIFGG